MYIVEQLDLPQTGGLWVKRIGEGVFLSDIYQCFINVRPFGGSSAVVFGLKPYISISIKNAKNLHFLAACQLLP